MSALRTVVQRGGQVNELTHSPQRSANQALRCYTEVIVDTTHALGCGLQLVEGILSTTLAPRLLGHEVRQFEVSPSDSALEELVRDTKDSVRRTVSGAYAEAPSLNP